MFKAFKNLSPRTRAGVGLAVIAWGTAGLYLSDHAEEKFGFTPSEEDQAKLNQYTPRIITVDKEEQQR